jgi:hypothetical protein
MRPALDKIVSLYKTSPVFQDLVETAAATTLAAGGQALLTDMTPEQIAIASAAGFGAGMVGRPIVGRAGQAIGGVIDRRAPQSSQRLKEVYNRGEGLEMYPKELREMMMAKMGPYKDLGGYAQTGQLLGRGYGDNLAQLAVAVAAPGIFGDQDQ